jgi:hypothetical protein
VSVPVPPAARARDAVALGLVAAGAGAYLYAWRGMQALADKRVVLEKGKWMMTEWNTYYRISRLGVGGMVAGALVAAWSFHKMRQPAAPALPAPDAALPDALPE